MSKIAVVLFNLGGPDRKKSIRPFLFNFFMDKNIIPAPLPIRYALAQYISITRSRKEAGTSYGFLGDKSPLLENTNAQAQALEKALNAAKAAEYKVFVCMRYWHPMADETARAVKNWGAARVVLLPLYPQFSTTTTWSSLGAWRDAAAKIDLKIPESTICCYPFNAGFIKASAENIRAAMMEAKTDGHHVPRVLFSAHGLPERVIEGGDPYQWQCEQTAAKIAAELDISDWQVCYQSRVGRLKWIGPSTEEALEQAAKDKKAVVIYPHAFTQEHVETLVEIEIEYREKAHHMGLHGFYRAAAVATHPAFIKGLAALVTGAEDGIKAEGGACLCPPQYGRCCMTIQGTGEGKNAKLAA